MKTFCFVVASLLASCTAQISSSTTTTTTGATTSLPAGCAGTCIGGDCPVGYVCNTTTQQCCLSTSASTPSTACVDKIGPKGYSDCPDRVFLCNNTLYYSLMSQQCPKTCGRCGGATATSIGTTVSSGSCVDKTKSDGTSDCPGLVRLCNNPAYFSLMSQECPKTCGRCNGVSTTTSTVVVGKK